jgi:uncharacterized protein GlcG (DUF336 family)
MRAEHLEELEKQIRESGPAIALDLEEVVLVDVRLFGSSGLMKHRMDGAAILCIEIAQNKAYTALFGVPTQDFFNFIQGDPFKPAGKAPAAQLRTQRCER